MARRVAATGGGDRFLQVTAASFLQRRPAQSTEDRDERAGSMCALFYDYSVKSPSGLRQVCSAWGEQDAVLAVALENREIHFFSDEVRAWFLRLLTCL